MLDDADEDVFERKTTFARFQDADSGAFEFFAGGADGDVGGIVADDMEPTAENGNAPVAAIGLEQIGGALGLIDAKFEEVAFLLGLDFAGGAFEEQFTGNHEAETIALLGFFEIMRSDENGSAGIGEVVDHRPERAAGERIDAGSGLI